jgi:hypothetical protein
MAAWATADNRPAPAIWDAGVDPLSSPSRIIQETSRVLRDILRSSATFSEAKMYAVVAMVNITDNEAAANTLTEQVIPMVKQAPGFVGAYFVQLDERHGTSVVVFESEEQARAGAPEVGGGSPGVTFTNVMFGEVVGHA